MPSGFRKGEQRADEATTTGPGDYDAASRPTVDLSDLVSVPDEASVDAAVADSSSGGIGLVAEATSVSGNTVSVAVYDVASLTNTDAGAELESGFDLSNTTITVRGRGY